MVHPGISLPAGRCTGGKRGCFLLIFFLFRALPQQPPTYLLYNTVLMSLSGLPTVAEQTRLEVRRTWDGAERRNGLHSASGTEATLLSAMKQKCLQITNRIASLGVNQHRTHSFHVSSDGLFSTCFSRPISADGKAFRGRMGAVLHLALTFNRVLVWRAGVLGRVCVRACACTQLAASISVRFCIKAEKVCPIQQNKALNLFLVCLSWEWQFKITLEDKDTFLEWILLSSFP